MATESILKRVRIFSGKVKAASNIATLLFLAAMAYSISQWHKASGFDSFINIVVAVMILTVNIKLYRIYLELRNTYEMDEESKILSLYKLQKKEYKEWLLVPLLMLTILLLLEFILT